MYSMEGGINAWEGLVATGVPEAGMAFFSDMSRPEEIIGIAWLLEEGARRFYNGVADMFDDKESVQLFKDLGAAEVRHKQILSNLYRDLPGSEAGSELPSTVSAEDVRDVMEGGMRIGEALKRVKGMDLLDLVDYAIALETNSYDLYIKMEREMQEAGAKKVFQILAREEKTHLDRITSALEKKL